MEERRESPSRQTFCLDDGGPQTYIAGEIRSTSCQGSISYDCLLTPYYMAGVTAEGFNLLETDQVMNK